ncbi:DnaJ C-terminal domain-containing protein [Rhizobium sp. 32-5/1]|uniref:DnaJ C-terminal domain-containing protein n=1 Tax=Rhizobium sp. 32-5/1 TaxID=3019602 RepID=UPI00240E5A4F|nr:DnaJ C-terminal domain-containing protein [Rhizobium sp. 32-5/1]WEZ85257.1 DnaJ C-terminal domain-containing protein [Rhizobium sp. 32-5/1]
MRDPYSILGVRRNAAPDEIKAAWRAVAKAVHPDQNRDDPLATARFAEAGRAYEVLKNPKLRSRYDDARREAELRRMEEMHRKTREPEQPIGDVDPETAEEMVSRIFGSETKPRKAEPAATSTTPPRPKPTVKPEVKSEPKAEAKPETAADARPEPAPEAKTDTTERPIPFAIFPRSAAPAAELVSAIVRRIRGTASKAIEKVPDIACEVTVSVEDLFNRAKATATLPDGQTLKVALPAGTTDGSIIRMKELGYRLNGMLRGDIVVTVRVRQDSTLRTDGLDLRTTLSIDIQNAVLGCETKVMTLTGPVDVAVPAWSGSDKIIRLAGHGLADADGRRADLLVELRLMLWETPDERITDLMRSRQQGLFL